MKEASMPNYVHNFAAMLVVAVCATSVSLPAYAFHPADDPLVLDVRLALAGVNFEYSCAFDADAGDSLFRWTEWVVAATTVGKRWAVIESARAGKTLPKEILARNLARQIVLSNKELWERWLTDYGWKVDPFRNAVVSVAKNGEITVDPRLASMDQYKAYGLMLGKTYLLPCDPAWVDGWSGMVHEAEQQLAENLATVRADPRGCRSVRKGRFKPILAHMRKKVTDFVREVRADADNILTKTVPGDAAYDAVFELRGQLNILEVFGLAEIVPADESGVRAEAQ
jgi:hypothetical protein